uniref:Predicted nucleic-acid-binding protein, contains PIN domain n=1 Tax=Candidatus Kentrum sp. SD TaxID=2126332 RepID=A0A450YVG9_9GAMM|nr:MAG: Predicted nucleic-acid-binding protein, contains PIN domain [Candidatus Kentron sp. SD]VFK49735.1 MAG: Predicted nucleic-acid-binding protein, contains PIN domain [Candidatus Kentron sp. SD]
MIALDTNVIVRFLVRDDEQQAQMVYTRFKAAEREDERLFVPLPVVLELIWVLGSSYKMSRGEILRSITSLRQMPILRFEADAIIERLPFFAEQTWAELDDLLIALSAEAAGCETTLTFDKRAARSPLFELFADEVWMLHQSS